LQSRGLGTRTLQFRLRDAVFGRQRYWGEPIPIAYRDGVPEGLDAAELPLRLPAVDKYLPTADGEPPLARAEHWVSAEGLPLETTTMPGWAGSSWYFLRYMDPRNDRTLVGRAAADYWGQVDLGRRGLLGSGRPLCGRKRARHRPPFVQPILDPCAS
ncbi:MAG: hypothetical protein RL558_940, partial [Bacteroidota bacterium]